MNALAALFLSIVPVNVNQEPAQKEAAPARQVYDEKADARADVNAALARATKENRRVLVVWGANWCGWCVKLADVFKKNPELAGKLQYEYDVVKVDVGNFDKHMELAASFGAEFKSTGIPFLTVLAADGKVLANRGRGRGQGEARSQPLKEAGLDRRALGVLCTDRARVALAVGAFRSTR